MSESVQFRIDDNEAAQAAVKKHQVDSVPGVTDAQPALATDEGEVPAKLEQEVFEPSNQSLFEIAL